MGMDSMDIEVDTSWFSGRSPGIIYDFTISYLV